MNHEVTADLVSREPLSKLAKRAIIKGGEKRGSYVLQASVSGICGRKGPPGAEASVRLPRRGKGSKSRG